MIRNLPLTHHLVFRTGILFCAAMLAGCKPPTPVAQVSVDEFLRDVAAKAAAAQKVGTTVIRGKDGWLFFAPELRSISIGPFWGAAAHKVSRAYRPEDADPLPAILDFKAQLDRAGIKLILVPVPAKAVIYPDELSTSIPPNSPIPRLDRYDQQFFTLLEQKGVRVLDLTPTFLQHRNDPVGALYCKQDTHWSGIACAMAAKLIATEIQKEPWVKTVPPVQYTAAEKTVPITGDLWAGAKDPALPKEQLPLSFVKTEGGGQAGTTISRKSPVLLLGDSHDLIFHAGEDMLAVDAGLPDQLALDLGFPVDLVAVRGSGATPARINLLHRRDNLAGKKVVVWCFSVREFTESQGWKKVPVIRQYAALV